MNPRARKFGGRVKKYSGTDGSAVSDNDGKRVWTDEEIKGPKQAKVVPAPSRTPTAQDKKAMKEAEDNDRRLVKTLNMKKGGAVKKNWIKDAIKKPGALRSSLKVKKGEKIPAKKLATAAKAPGKMGQRARLAQTLKKLK
jgi:hypothetical protein